MKKNTYTGQERRKFPRLNFATPFACKICKKKTISKILEGYTSDISQAGMLCSVQEKVNKGDILWLSFDRSTLAICEELEKRSLIYQNGVVAKVARIEHKKGGPYNVGVQFLTREERNLTHIYPKVYFLKEQYEQQVTES